MNKQYMKEVQKCKKAYLLIVCKMYLYYSIAKTGDNMSTIQRTEAKKCPRMVF